MGRGNKGNAGGSLRPANSRETAQPDYRRYKGVSPAEAKEILGYDMKDLQRTQETIQDNIKKAAANGSYNGSSADEWKNVNAFVQDVIAYKTKSAAQVTKLATRLGIPKGDADNIFAMTDSALVTMSKMMKNGISTSESFMAGVRKRTDLSEAGKRSALSDYQKQQDDFTNRLKYIKAIQKYRSKLS